MKPVDLSLNINFNFRLINNDLVLRAYASLSFNLSQYRISTFNNKVSLYSNQHVLLFDCDFMFEDEIFHLQCNLRLISQYDLLLGMEFKKARCTITNEKFPEPVTATLKQKAWSRIKNIPAIHVSSNSGWVGRWKEKSGILNKLYHQAL